MEVPYIPPIKSATNTSNFESYLDSYVESPSVDKNEVPFLKW